MSSIASQHYIDDPRLHTSRKLESLLSAYSVSLPTDETGWEHGRASAAASLSEIYPRFLIEKALDYLHLVRYQLSGKPLAYDQFFRVLKLYEEDRIELRDALLRLMIMCKEYPVVLLELNYFLPPRYRFNVHTLEPSSVYLQTPGENVRAPI
ncbi:hypothetical protein C8Q79DRAFT_678734 [Trametes meyenii]|nr:hypothetical protein C8Q79DRAFT_678734 [Trametes meyenii]